MTAVEWLIQQLSKEWQLEDRDLYLIDQAKEMEKEQIKNERKEAKEMQQNHKWYTEEDMQAYAFYILANPVLIRPHEWYRIHRTKSE
jgi:hypothetical protein